MPETVSRPNSRLADFLPYLLSVTSNAVSGAVADTYQAKFGIRIAEWRVMAVLGDARTMTQRELVCATLMDKVAVNRASKHLEARGLIARSPNNRDGRSHHLGLTDEGRALHGAIMPLAQAMEEAIFEPLDEAERNVFKAMLARVRASAANFKGGDGAGMEDGIA